eukprot:TRINITY_DN3813_c0_g1_i1.p1 TRINITY_DN3813_c0_g1~~TRINITY_DN3813_c0_g1_i1.p1  ORF type:complete len:258 (-),score=51.74 TRINITY_DN3813_c0_g1_i1:97-831(-)
MSELSARERAIAALNKAEEDARSEFSSSRPVSVGSGSSSGGVPRRTASTGKSAFGASVKLSTETIDAVKAFVAPAAPAVGLLLLRVDEPETPGDDSVTLSEAGSHSCASGAEAADALAALDEPRFVLVGRSGRTEFAYVCGSKAARKLRMLYSTAKKDGAAQCRSALPSLGSVTHEWDEADARDQLDASAAAAARTAPAAAKPKATGRTAVTISGQHPVMSLFGNASSSTSTKKKIVIPPRGAY